MQSASCDKYTGFEGVSSDKGDYAEFQQEYGNTVNLLGNPIPEMSGHKPNVPTFGCRVPPCVCSLPFVGRTINLVAEKMAT